MQISAAPVANSFLMPTSSVSRCGTSANMTQLFHVLRVKILIFHFFPVGLNLFNICCLAKRFCCGKFCSSAFPTVRHFLCRIECLIFFNFPLSQIVLWSSTEASEVPRHPYLVQYSLWVFIPQLCVFGNFGFHIFYQNSFVFNLVFENSLLNLPCPQSKKRSKFWMHILLKLVGESFFWSRVPSTCPCMMVREA